MRVSFVFKLFCLCGVCLSYECHIVVCVVVRGLLFSCVCVVCVWLKLIDVDQKVLDVVCCVCCKWLCVSVCCCLNLMCVCECVLLVVVEASCVFVLHCVVMCLVIRWWLWLLDVVSVCVSGVVCMCCVLRCFCVYCCYCVLLFVVVCNVGLLSINVIC